MTRSTGLAFSNESPTLLCFLSQTILYQNLPTGASSCHSLTDKSELEAGMHFVAHYPSDDDPASIWEETRLELAACFPDSTFYELDYAISASTVIYVTVLKNVDGSSVNHLANALSNWQPPRPTITLKWAPESDCQEVFELKELGESEKSRFILPMCRALASLTLAGTVSYGHWDTLHDHQEALSRNFVDCELGCARYMLLSVDFSIWCSYELVHCHCGRSS